jgi:hypothetical protein
MIKCDYITYADIRWCKFGDGHVRAFFPCSLPQRPIGLPQSIP